MNELYVDEQLLNSGAKNLIASVEKKENRQAPFVEKKAYDEALDLALKGTMFAVDSICKARVLAEKLRLAEAVADNLDESVAELRKFLKKEEATSARRAVVIADCNKIINEKRSEIAGLERIIEKKKEIIEQLADVILGDEVANVVIKVEFS